MCTHHCLLCFQPPRLKKTHTIRWKQAIKKATNIWDSFLKIKSIFSRQKSNMKFKKSKDFAANHEIPKISEKKTSTPPKQQFKAKRVENKRLFACFKRYWQHWHPQWCVEAYSGQCYIFGPPSEHILLFSRIAVSLLATDGFRANGGEFEWMPFIMHGWMI